MSIPDPGLIAARRSDRRPAPRLIFLSLLAGLLAAQGPARAADNGDWDWRLGWGTAPALEDSDWGSVFVSHHASWDAGGHSLELNFTHRYSAMDAHAGYITFGVARRTWAGSGGDGTALRSVDLGVGAVQFGGGYSYRPRSRYTLEIGARLGAGTADVEEGTGKATYGSHTGFYFSGDLGVTALVSLDRWELGGSLGYATWLADVDYPDQGNPNNGTFETGRKGVVYSGDGLFATLQAGFR